MDEIVVLGLVEAARRLGLSVGTVRGYADAGILPAFRDSAGRRLFLPSDVQALRSLRDALGKRAPIRGGD